jgi:hypothetical protein
MRRLIAYLNSLLLGAILGMIFVAIVHSCPSHWQQRIRAAGITIGHKAGCPILANQEWKTASANRQR